MHPKRKRTLQNVAIAVLTLAVAVLAYTQFAVPTSRMPEWIVVEEGPVAHGFEKFYRSVYVKGNLKAKGDLTIGGISNLGSEEIAVTYGKVITPTTSHVRLSNTATITNANLGSGLTAGQLLILSGINVSGTITITEGSNHFGGALVFTDQAYDAGSLIWDGTRWVLASWHDN